MAFLHKNIRLDPTKYKGMQWYFVTMCCAGRRRVFADAEQASWIVDELRQRSASHGFGVHAYCAMPDHLHALLRGLHTTSDLLVFMKNLKQTTAYEFRRKFRRDLWQKKFYDHILRRKDSVGRVASYIWMNPVRRGLCDDMLGYPHSGSLVLDRKREIAPVEIWTPPWKQKTPA
jgi:putative transposase